MFSQAASRVGVAALSLLVACQERTAASPVEHPSDASSEHVAAQTSALPEPGVAPEPGPALPVRSAAGPVREVSTPPRAPLPVEFHLVAAREGNVEFHPVRGPAPRMLLGATVPYPVAADGSVETLSGVYRGLIPMPPDEYISEELAGGFSRDGDGWLRLWGDYSGPGLEAVPASYAWRGDRWELSRDKRGPFVGLHGSFEVRGDSVWAMRTYLRLDRLDRVLVDDDDADRHRGAPAGQLEHLGGKQPRPIYPGTDCAAHGVVTTTSGELATTGWVPDDDGVQTLHLLHFRPGQAEPQARVLPDVGPLPADTRAYRDCLTTSALFDGRVAVHGEIGVEGYAVEIGYLAVGDVEKLRRIYLEVDGMALSSAVEDVVERADGSYWLVIDGELWARSADGVLRAMELPQVPWPELASGWVLGDTWREATSDANRTTRSRPLRALELEQLGGHLWLRVGVDVMNAGEVIEAVLTTGPHRQPIALPSTEMTMGEISRFTGESRALRLLGGLDDDAIADFVDTRLDAFTEREEVWQIYEAGSGSALEVIAIVEPRAWNPSMMQDYAKLLGQRPQLLDEVPRPNHILWDS